MTDGELDRVRFNLKAAMRKKKIDEIWAAQLELHEM